MLAICDAGCNKTFEHTGKTISRLPGEIEKTFFTCPHCQLEYVLHYTDPEIRKLQAKIQKTLAKKVNPGLTYKAAVAQEKRIQKQINCQRKVIADKMAALKKRMEGSDNEKN